MRKADALSSAVLLLLGVGTGAESLRLGVGSWMLPGPGFLPLGASLVLIFLAIAILIRAWPGGVADAAVGQDSWPHANNLRTVVSVLVALGMYALVWNTLGFSLSTCMLLAFLFRYAGRQRWAIVIAGTLVTTLACYLLFGVFLKVELPVGVIGF
jgi:hypothetical protein